MQTSYFAKYKGSDGVAICLYKPYWFKGEHYPTLAPTKEILEDYKNGDIDEEEYIRRYKEDVLSKLNPKEVYNDLKDKVLLCYERYDKFCHRHIVAQWLSEELDVNIKEI